MLDPLLDIARDAGRAILAVYRSDFAVQAKDDASPLTADDEAAHRVIVAGLAALTPDIPVLSEESAAAPWAESLLSLWAAPALNRVDGLSVLEDADGTTTLRLKGSVKPTFNVYRLDDPARLA